MSRHLCTSFDLPFIIAPDVVLLLLSLRCLVLQPPVRPPFSTIPFSWSTAPFIPCSLRCRLLRLLHRSPLYYWYFCHLIIFNYVLILFVCLCLYVWTSPLQAKSRRRCMHRGGSHCTPVGGASDDVAVAPTPGMDAAVANKEVRLVHLPSKRIH